MSFGRPRSSLVTAQVLKHHHSNRIVSVCAVYHVFLQTQGHDMFRTCWVLRLSHYLGWLSKCGIGRMEDSGSDLFLFFPDYTVVAWEMTCSNRTLSISLSDYATKTYYMLFCVFDGQLFVQKYPKYCHLVHFNW